eukprot:CAMPEP_0173385644 /NCGR_PEP_ID=MMETSP1356-20130122/8261_1 /TAXON_ID=77927 ORGANISM="Hemiselmis virescens, Strain PCC157" /NCGR_SAMPLE_ID=MMETSP1356 /ASSEMBLY_ACC=CAM_ASM_000847 /LENGTH=184 /DNA_ID=CAMNT_0014341539 /DNA_START=151 /DNA_END=702 /DNA_ORIENTATION=+
MAPRAAAVALVLLLGLGCCEAFVELPRGMRVGGHHPDLYGVLGVSSGADDAEIRKAYRRRAMVHHPDRAGGSSSEFELLSFAVETLSDPVKRADYDLCGLAGVQQGSCQRVLVRGKGRGWWDGNNMLQRSRGGASSEDSEEELSVSHCTECCSGAWGSDLKAQCQRVRPCSESTVCRRARGGGA